MAPRTTTQQRTTDEKTTPAADEKATQTDAAETATVTADAADEFSNVTVMKVDKISAPVTALDKIPASIRAHVTLAATEGPQLIIAEGWDAAKRKKYMRLAKAVSPHLPGGKAVKAVPQKTTDGRDAIGLTVYTPRKRAPKVDVPPVAGEKKDTGSQTGA